MVDALLFQVRGVVTGLQCAVTRSIVLAPFHRPAVCLDCKVGVRANPAFLHFLI
jgi:hypothetical protein